MLELIAAFVRLAEIGFETHKVSIEGTDPAVRTELLKLQIELLKIILEDVREIRKAMKTLTGRDQP